VLSPPDYLGVSALNADTLYSVIWFDLAEPGWDDDAVKSRHSEIIGEITFDAATMPALGTLLQTYLKTANSRSLKTRSG
jgi:hypothetical protein